MKGRFEAWEGRGAKRHAKKIATTIVNVSVEMKNVMESADDSGKLMAQKEKRSDGILMEPCVEGVTLDIQQEDSSTPC